eukprot:scaffold798_cov268-Chaetoceros_neogracile.AAC.28
MSVARKAPQIIFRISPLLALVGTNYAYSSHDKRDLVAEEIYQIHGSLERLDGLHSGSRKLEADVRGNVPNSTSRHTGTPILRQHLTNLESSGVTLIRSVLTPIEADQWDKTIAHKIDQVDGTCIMPAGGAIGRVHCKLVKRRHRLQKNKEEDGLYENLAQVPNKDSCTKAYPGVAIRLNDIARGYFASHGIKESQYDLAQLQLLDAAPQSSNQLWHRDNVRPGLTVIIALRDVGANGPTEMILQSHRRSPVGMLSGMLDDNPGLPRILLASINCGDAICYDSRILHRGRGYGNTSGDNQEFEHRPVLVIRWDANHSPAPGTGMIGTQLAKWAGTSLALVATLLDWLP